MKALRYVIFLQFLLALGVLAVVYAAPDALLLTASAAESSALETHPQTELREPQPVLSDEIASEAPVAVESQMAAETAVELARPVQVPIQSETESLRDRQAVIPARDLAASPGSVGLPDGIADVQRFDPGLADEASAQGLDLRERLRVEAELGAFVREVSTGHAGIVRGVYVADTLAMPVRRQPSGYPGFISSEAGVATQFGMAEYYGSIGLLAHNDLAGAEFFGLEEGQEVHVVYGDGAVHKFTVSEIYRYRAGQPNSPYSEFYDLDNGEAKYSAKEIFHMMYNRDGDVVFQTCIAGDGISTWGRLFIIASPA